jgi:hypothetical protein
LHNLFFFFKIWYLYKFLKFKSICIYIYKIFKNNEKEKNKNKNMSFEIN